MIIECSISSRAGTKQGALMPLNRRLFLASWIALLVFAGAAQAQSFHGRAKSPSLETETSVNYLQPWQPCLNPDQGGIKRTLQEGKGQSSPSVTGSIINKDPVAGAQNACPKSDSSGSSFGKKRGSITQDRGSQVGGVDSSLTIPGTTQSGGFGASFLDGYLSKSFQDKGIGRRKGTGEKESKGDLPQRKLQRPY